MASLADSLKRRIALEGPLTVADYMAEVAAHPGRGVYSGDPLGATGHFITAPEISQMFGELIGLWAATVWKAMGEPDPVSLVELGPGRGTLMVDALRAAQAAPEFRSALRPFLVEISPVLKERQRHALGGAAPDVEAVWLDDLSRVPDGPRLFIANEFFDALPIRQFQKFASGWSERLVDVDPRAGGFRFIQARPGLAAAAWIGSEAPVGTWVEISPAAVTLAHAISTGIKDFGGAALIIDYGAVEARSGSSLGVVRAHAAHDVLADPGSADLSAHVDFAALRRAATEAGATVHGPVSQGQFLRQLGIESRAEVLAARNASAAPEIRSALRRLVDPTEMGTLFKALAITRDPSLPPGFERYNGVDDPLSS